MAAGRVPGGRAGHAAPAVDRRVEVLPGQRPPDRRRDRGRAGHGDLAVLHRAGGRRALFAAGNSADELYYERGIDAWDFEIGNDIWNDATQEWDGVGFQPPFDEAHAESQEYAGGLIELVRVAANDNVTAAARR